jgi:hypothetical protein
MTALPHEPVANEPSDEGEASLPELKVDIQDASRDIRRSALVRLDALLDQLETANLYEKQSVPPRAVSELRALGLPDPEVYSPVQLMAIVFRAQGPLLRARPPVSRHFARL